MSCTTENLKDDRPKADTPLFSVIMPLYNKSSYIERAIGSVLAQDELDFELIVVDDGSTDGSTAKARAFTDPRVVVHTQANLGGAGGQARNTGMAMARGRWFAYLDADDMWLPGHLAETRRLIDFLGEPGLVSPRSCEVTDGDPIPSPTADGPPPRRANYFAEIDVLVERMNCSSVTIHRNVFTKLGGFRFAPAGDDLDYWLRIALEFPIAVSTRVTALYFRATGGVMETLQSPEDDAAAPDFTNWGDVSPSLATLAARTQVDPALLMREDIRGYINQRLFNAMKINLRRSRPQFAREFFRLMVGRPQWRACVFNAVAHLPRGVLRIANAIYSRAR